MNISKEEGANEGYRHKSQSLVDLMMKVEEVANLHQINEDKKDPIRFR